MHESIVVRVACAVAMPLATDNAFVADNIILMATEARYQLLWPVAPRHDGQLPLPQSIANITGDA
jgi:hypothetical protein